MAIDSTLFIRILMKKFIGISVFSILCASSACALNFYAGRLNAPSDERDIKWSTCVWGDNINFETKPLPSKPGPNDHASSRFGNFTLNIDVDVNVLSLGCGDGSQNIAKGRTIRTKRNMGVSIATFNSGESAMIFEKCNVEVGGSFNFSFWHEAKGAGIGRLSLTDTKMAVKGDLTSAIPANPLIQNGARAGVVVEVAGKSQLMFNGGAVMDSLHIDDPSQWILKFGFTEVGGNVPTIYFNKRAELAGADIDIKISKNVKTGKFALMEFYDRRSGIDKPNKITVNDEPYTFGTPIKLGDKTAKIYLGAFGRDPRTQNDLILEVK